MKILILGASYGSLLSTKLLMAGHDVTLVCRENTANLINSEGTIIRLTLRGEDEPRLFASKDFSGKVDAKTPRDVQVTDYDLIVLAMQEPQYSQTDVKSLMGHIASAKLPCLSIMNMPPLPYLKRIKQLSGSDLRQCYKDPEVWEGFEPGLISLCSPDPQAFRPPDMPANFLHVGLPTNFKAACFENDGHNSMLKQLENDIEAIKIDGKDIPVKLRVYDSIFVPLAKWSMLLAGNYSCVRKEGEVSIHDAVHTDLVSSKTVYNWVSDLIVELGSNPEDLVPFAKYANAAKSLGKPSSVARAIAAGAVDIERVDRLIQLVAASMNRSLPQLDAIVDTVDARLAANRAAI